MDKSKVVGEESDLCQLMLDGELKQISEFKYLEKGTDDAV